MDDIHVYAAPAGETDNPEAWIILRITSSVLDDASDTETVTLAMDNK